MSALKGIPSIESFERSIYQRFDFPMFSEIAPERELEDRLPPSTGFLGQLETLSLYNNHFSGEFPSSLENCTKLSLLDLGVKDFFGNIPVSIGKNLSRLILRETELHHYQLSFDGIDHYSNGERTDNSYIEHVMIKWQGKVNEFGSTLGLVKTIDLSSNNLTGQIPYELTYLQVLVVLDLSQYTLVGEIPQDIGQMKELLTLNLSRNMFSGEIPSTMSQMDRLNDLDVSYNNLSGRIPSSTQLQSFPPQRFTGNVRLCGLPTAKKCLEDEDLGVPPVGDSDGDAESTDEFQRWFYIGGATAFASAFWIACSTLLLNRHLRHAFFRFHDCLKDWVYVKVVVFIGRLRRVARG
nr:leucine-rich repeat domain, L domain-like protein [Tanacetum cinerariifolium]